MLALVGSDLAANRALKRLRRASHLLSPLRDMDAMIETARTLGPSRKSGQATLAKGIDAQLTTEKRRLNVTAQRDDVRAEAARALDGLRRDARDWQWKNVDSSLLARAMKRSYKRARNAMHDASAKPQPETLHDWRKRVKTLWYGLRLLEHSAPRLRRSIADLKRLETWLGDDHNLSVLQKHFGSGKSSRIGARTRAHLRTLTERRQRELRRQSLAIGARVFAHPPKAFAQRLRNMSETSKRRQRPTAAA